VFHSLQKEKQEEVVRRAEARKKGRQSSDGAEREARKGAGPGMDLSKVKVPREGLPPSKHDRLDKAKRDAETRALYKEGRLVHRTEPELKTHTSYLVFAVLPRQWTKEDEDKARRKYG
jgi:tRNA (adenine57-N1/adenine58-N1)-methyltransferase